MCERQHTLTHKIGCSSHGQKITRLLTKKNWGDPHSLHHNFYSSGFSWNVCGCCCSHMQNIFTWVDGGQVTGRALMRTWRVRFTIMKTGNYNTETLVYTPGTLTYTSWTFGFSHGTFPYTNRTLVSLNINDICRIFVYIIPTDRVSYRSSSPEIKMKICSKEFTDRSNPHHFLLYFFQMSSDFFLPLYFTGFPILRGEWGLGVPLSDALLLQKADRIFIFIQNLN